MQIATCTITREIGEAQAARDTVAGTCTECGSRCRRVWGASGVAARAAVIVHQYAVPCSIFRQGIKTIASVDVTVAGRHVIVVLVVQPAIAGAPRKTDAASSAFALIRTSARAGCATGWALVGCCVGGAAVDVICGLEILVDSSQRRWRRRQGWRWWLWRAGRQRRAWRWW